MATDEAAGDDVPPPGKWYELTDAEIEACRVAYEATGNPLHIWSFIKARRSEAFERASEALPPTDAPEWRDATRKLLACQMDFRPLPPWVEEYLYRAAWRLMELSKGRDWRHVPWKQTGDEEKDRAAYRAYRETPSVRSWPAAADLAAASLDPTQNGWNAFAAEDKAREASEAVDVFSMHRSGFADNPPRSAAEARELAMSEFGFTDERAFRRFLKKGKPRAKPAP